MQKRNRDYNEFLKKKKRASKTGAEFTHNEETWAQSPTSKMYKIRPRPQMYKNKVKKALLGAKRELDTYSPNTKAYIRTRMPLMKYELDKDKNSIVD